MFLAIWPMLGAVIMLPMTIREIFQSANRLFSILAAYLWLNEKPTVIEISAIFVCCALISLLIYTKPEEEELDLDE